jgi:anti-sigma factor RsiW
MTCGDVETLLDAFLDSELPPPMLVSVARHAAGCAACDDSIRSMTQMRERLADAIRVDAAALDLSALWPRIEAAVDATERRRRWSERVRGTPVWIAGLAAAAAALLMVRSLQQSPPTAGVRVARFPPNHAYIDRLAGRDVLLRREAKSGTTVIWVNHVEDY